MEKQPTQGALYDFVNALETLTFALSDTRDLDGGVDAILTEAQLRAVEIAIFRFKVAVKELLLDVFGFAVVKRRGHVVPHAYAVMPLWQMARILDQMHEGG